MGLDDKPKVVQVASAKPNQDLIEKLEIILAEAKAGSLHTAIIACASMDGCIYTAWSTHRGVSNALTLGALERVKWDYIDHEFEKR